VENTTRKSSNNPLNQRRLAQCVGRNRRRRRGFRPPALQPGTSSRQRMRHLPVPEGVTETSCSLPRSGRRRGGSSCPCRRSTSSAAHGRRRYFRSLHRFRELRGSGGRAAGAGEDNAQPGRQRSATCRRRTESSSSGDGGIDALACPFNSRAAMDVFSCTRAMVSAEMQDFVLRLRTC
jgi:hypothetical protein